MNKTLLVTSIALSLSTSPAQAAFTSLTDGYYQLVITGGCYSAGNCQADNIGALSDNLDANQASIEITTAIGPLSVGTYGSGIVGDGLMGVIDFSLNGGSISVNYFSQDSFLNTYASTIFQDASDTSAMGGTIDGSGNMVFNPTGRRGLFGAFITSLGANAWNIDDSLGGNGLYDIWTTGTSTNRAVGLSPGFAMTGTTLQDSSSGVWTGTLVSAANIGASWGPFGGTATSSGVQTSSLYNITITSVSVSAVPVPAALWLFGSGLLGLVGVARRKHS